ncbi:alpha/beta fold hydrolase [Massilia sp. DD77]|uniref:alpha/beta fold hydrolase n=1 Tax=Massilia sp. DD77 TaxID=3109349 RepID=UPI002FFDC2BA
MHLAFPRRPGAAVLLCALMAAALPAPAQDQIKVGDYQVQMATLGTGRYTVLLEAGFGRDLTVWRRVAPALADAAIVVAYSRAGLGRSDARPGPVDLAARTRELEQLVATAKLQPPFILVGHSYGAFLIRSYAARHPEQVAGMVFVDPSHERFELELRKLDASRVDSDNRAIEGFTPPAMRAELRSVQAILERGELGTPGRLPDVPVAVLTSVQQREAPQLFLETPAAVKVWRGLHDSLFREFSSGSHVVTPDSGHNIHLEQPELVVSAVRQVIATAGAREAKRKLAQARADLFQRLAEDGADVGAALAASGFDEAERNRIAYELLGPRKQVQLAVRVMRANAERFADSANAQDSYGEGLLATGQAGAAKAQFQKALALAEAQGKAGKALAGYRGNLDKAERALAASP